LLLHLPGCYQARKELLELLESLQPLRE
jgi:hypothetical protein